MRTQTHPIVYITVAATQKIQKYVCPDVSNILPPYLYNQDNILLYFWQLVINDF